MGQFRMVQENLPQPYEGAHDKYSDFDGTGCIEYGCRHDRSVFGKNIGQRR